MEFVPNEKATPIRYPSIANLMVDSNDRDIAVYPLCNDYQINKKNSLLNGFFTRVGATEVVMEWNTYNVAGGQYVVEYTTNTSFDRISIPAGFYTVAGLLDILVELLNAPNPGITWTAIASVGGGAALEVTTGVNTFDLIDAPGTNLLDTLFGRNDLQRADFYPPTPATGPGQKGLLRSIDLRPVRYVDIVCNQLTNNQSVKDASTAPIVRDVLVRWYFDYDNQGPLDAYGYPILMGYEPFYIRRLYNPPKQIQWQTNIPIGNLSFQLYNDLGVLVNVNQTTDYLMTLQISEN
jgi:hypothetical protein